MKIFLFSFNALEIFYGVLLERESNLGNKFELVRLRIDKNVILGGVNMLCWFQYVHFTSCVRENSSPTENDFGVYSQNVNKKIFVCADKK